MKIRGTSVVAYDRLPLSTGAVLLLCGIGDRTDSDGDRDLRSTTESSARNQVGRTALAYVSEKLHQGDADGDVFIGALGEEPALVLRRQSDGGTYCTYIYEYEGALRELFLKEGAEVPPENGSVIAEIEAFSMEKISDGLFSFVCREESGEDADAAGQCAQPECRRDRS